MYYEMVKKLNPVAVEAYPSYLHKFCTELKNKNLSLEIPASFTSSEMLMDFQRTFIEPVLKTKIHDWYGNAERTILLAQNNDFSYQPLPLYSINEYHEHKVITTGLINNRFPLIRYEVNDSIELKSKGFLEDLINPEIIRINGRASDHLDLKDGSIVGCIDHAFKGVKHLETAQVHQYDVKEPIKIKIVAKSEFGKLDEEQLRANFERMVGKETELIFIYCKLEDLTFSKNEKFRLIIKEKPGAAQ
jgi:phenylacetate-CoA ligase